MIFYSCYFSNLTIFTNVVLPFKWKLSMCFRRYSRPILPICYANFFLYNRILNILLWIWRTHTHTVRCLCSRYNRPTPAFRSYLRSKCTPKYINFSIETIQCQILSIRIECYRFLWHFSMNTFSFCVDFIAISIRLELLLFDTYFRLAVFMELYIWTYFFNAQSKSIFKML